MRSSVVFALLCQMHYWPENKICYSSSGHESEESLLSERVCRCNLVILYKGICVFNLNTRSPVFHSFFSNPSPNNTERRLEVKQNQHLTQQTLLLFSFRS